MNYIVQRFFYLNPNKGLILYYKIRILLLEYFFFSLGYVDAGMKTALHLREYEDVLNNEDIYSLLALASCANRAFGTCSKAFIKLESLEELTEQEREEYQELAMDIFVKYSPKVKNGWKLIKFIKTINTLIQMDLSNLLNCKGSYLTNMIFFPLQNSPSKNLNRKNS